MVTISNVYSINMDAYCRLCGSEDGIRVSIFEQGTDHVKKIHKVLPITVNEHDPFPKNMCHRCSFKVNEFFEFRTTCIQAQEFFKSKVPWLRDKQQVTSIEQNHPPMVEVPLNSVDAVSPNEKQVANGTVFIDENQPMIIIEDDSPNEDTAMIQNTLLNENGTQNKIVMRIKKSDIKRKPKTRSMWDSKRRKRRPRKSCRITEVFTTTLDEYQNIDNIENDPLQMSPTENTDHTPSYSCTIKSPKQEHIKTENGVLAKESTVENIVLPKYILITNIPRVGSVYTCENCGRTFLSPQPATLHTCDAKECSEDDNRSKESETMDNVGTEFYSCNECGKTFTRHSQLVTHQKKHSQADSSSDDNFTPFNHRRKHHSRHHKKRKSKPTLLPPKTFFTNFDQTEPGIMRHSLLSSDSD